MEPIPLRSLMLSSLLETGCVFEPELGLGHRTGSDIIEMRLIIARFAASSSWEQSSKACLASARVT